MRISNLLAGALLFCAPALNAQIYPPAQIDAGQNLFLEKCAFCHGKDTGGGEDGPDLTRSKLIGEDKGGDKMGPVIRNGRPATGMPSFTVSESELAALVAFIHNARTVAESQNGQRKGVDTSDLKTGNIEAGKQYFNGTGKCASCHSPTGDLAGVAKRNDGLKLFQRLMYPRGAKSKMTVTLADGKTITGETVYQDEFTVSLRDPQGGYHSYPTSKVKVKVDAPADAHVELLSRYTDTDIHNLMAYLLTLDKDGK